MTCNFQFGVKYRWASANVRKYIEFHQYKSYAVIPYHDFYVAAVTSSLSQTQQFILENKAAESWIQPQALLLSKNCLKRKALTCNQNRLMGIIYLLIYSLVAEITNLNGIIHYREVLNCSDLFITDKWGMGLKTIVPNPVLPCTQ